MLRGMVAARTSSGSLGRGLAESQAAADNVSAPVPIRIWVSRLRQGQRGRGRCDFSKEAQIFRMTSFEQLEMAGRHLFAVRGYRSVSRIIQTTHGPSLWAS